MQPPTFIDDRSCGSAREEPRGSADPAFSGNLKERDAYRYIAILGNYPKGDILMAARGNEQLREDRDVAQQPFGR